MTARASSAGVLGDLVRNHASGARILQHEVRKRSTDVEGYA